jgi:hypothetical protein
MLGVVAVATAWSGYQATRWAGEQSTLYAQASAMKEAMEISKCKLRSSSL